MTINVYCKNYGWLFRDLQMRMAALGAEASEEPLPDADAYICIRTMEFKKSPKPEKTVVQVHDMRDYRLDRVGCVSLVHPAQRKNVAGFPGRIVMQPIGSRDIEVGQLPETPTIGFFCREVGQQKRSRLFAEAVELARKSVSFEVLMIGYELESIQHVGRYERRAAEPDDYRRITALAAFSANMVPISAYEACAAGRLVISSPIVWPEGAEWKMVRKAKGADEVANHIIEATRNPKLFAPECPFHRDSWIRRQIAEAKRLCTD